MEVVTEQITTTSMPVITTKTVTINSNDLGISATVVLIFDVGNADHMAYKDFYPVVLKVASFGATGRYATTFRYTNQLSFVKPEQGKDGKHHDNDEADDLDDNLDALDQGQDSFSATWVDINPGQKTSLAHNGVVYQFTKPTSINQLQIQAWNESSLGEDIVVGYQRTKDTLPQSAWLFPRVGSGYDVSTIFVPIIRAYVVDGYKEDQVVRTPIQVTPIWTQNLGALASTTNLMLTWNAANGVYSIDELVL